MLAGAFTFFVLLGVLTWFYGYDSRDGFDWRGYEEARRFRASTHR